MDTFVLIDGNSLINRAFYALPLLSNKDGEFSNAVYGFSTLLIKIIEQVKPKYLTVAFDLKAPTFRHKMYDGYKATRKSMPVELASQLPILKELLKKMNINYVELAGFEADDIIGTLSRKYSTKNVILSADRDLLQLIDDKTDVWLTKRGVSDIKIMNEQVLMQEMQIKPYQVVELKSLMGDTADNIPGIKGIGEKTAAELIKKYQNLEGVYEHIEEIKGKLQEKLILDKQSGELSKVLATINTEVPIDMQLEDFAFDFPFNDAVYDMFVQYEFKTLLKRDDIFNKQDKSTPKRVTKIVSITNEAEFNSILEDILNSTMLAIYYNSEEMHLANSKFQEFIIKIKQNLLDDGVELSYLLNSIQPILENNKCETIAVDVKKIKHDMNDVGLSINGKYFDICIAEHLISGGKKAEIDTKKLTYTFNYEENSIASCMLKAKDEYLKTIHSMGLDFIYNHVEIPLVDILFNMELCGFKIDILQVENIYDKYEEQINSIKKDIYLLAGEEFNVNSPKQLSDILFNKLGLKIKGNKKNTGADVLEKIVDLHPIIPLVLKYRKFFKLKSTYLEAFLNLVDKKTSLIHTIFNQTVTSTGRLSSTEPNLQNIPVKEEEGKVLRKFFVSRFEGGKIISADYSQIELRLMAHCSQDDNLISAYKSSEDIHAKTASDIFNVNQSEVSPQMRRTAKAVNFGIIYGISEFGLSQNISITVKQAKEYIQTYFEKYPNVKKFMEKSVEQAKETGYSSSIYGRLRKIDELKTSNYVLRQFGERAAMNMPLQGTAADIVKLGMIKVNQMIKDKNLKSKLILQVHDELIIDCEPSEIEVVKQILKTGMETAVSLDVPLIVDVVEGDNWYDAK